MTKLLLYILLLLFIFPSLNFAQQNNTIPVSPEAAALTKMVDYPVNLNTGVPDIYIPFYEINVGGLKLPITLQYHAGGFKINERATRAGLGWSLSTDLQITRTVNGLDDFKNGIGYLSNNLARTYYPDNTCPGCRYPVYTTAEANALAIGAKDAAPDRFTYQLLDKSGSFYFQKDHLGTGYEIVPVPFDNIKIQYDNGAFIITDTDGTIYYFGSSGSGNELSKGIEMSGSIDEVGNCFGTDCVRSAWKCLRIVNSTRTDEITFTLLWTGTYFI